jgi:hypothetical protein
MILYDLRPAIDIHPNIDRPFRTKILIKHIDANSGISNEADMLPRRVWIGSLHPSHKGTMVMASQV